MKAPRQDITLTSGRIVKHSRQTNGSQLATMADNLPMSEKEWEEYCDLLKGSKQGDAHAR